ncbi:MAG: hypothetical protein M1818_004881 [Claussenomyces sp. TS43310]|nr:MAG: hypothetical protein M1818_004881 [Claussenomyces sp. TS43310]
MSSRALTLGRILLFHLFFTANAQSPREVAWSSRSYGPDGPWQAVTVSVGTPSQNFDLLPGGSWMSNVLSPSVCRDTVESLSCSPQASGFYNVSASSTSYITPVTSFVHNDSFAGVMGALPLFGNATWAFDEITFSSGYPSAGSVTVPDFDMFVISEGYSTLPDGSEYSLEVGNLALGAPDVNQSWARSGDSRWNGTLLTSYLYETGQTPSNSYGLHIGSAAIGIPGSLYVGGYDQSRVLGAVSTQEYGSDNLPIDLLDIGIGVAEGGSPFNYNAKSGLLAQGNSSIGGSMTILVDATAPYLYLPQSTCDAITRDLPVVYDATRGLYIWSTEDARYEQIVSSPSYLGFTFRLNSSVIQNMTINVPFSLLNLNLTAPLVTSPTPYFPCRPYSSGKEHGRFSLGRAFLQAAFVGVNWQTDHKGRWFLAQAPGPNTPSIFTPTAIGPTDNFLYASTNQWADTWKGHWTALESTTTTASGSAPNDGAGNNTASGNISYASHSTLDLSTGAKAGIAIGAVIVGMAIVVTLVICFERWRTDRNARLRIRQSGNLPLSNHRYGSSSIDLKTWGNERYKGAGFGPGELDAEHSDRIPELG